MYQFYTPSIKYPVGDRGLFRFYTYDVGVSVLKEQDGSYRLVETPSEDDQTNADIVYLGGHVHLVSDEEAANLSAAGFGDGLVLIP